MEEMLLIPSSGGAFEITAGHTKIYSKLETGVFPEVQDIIQKIENM
ncbi:Rdx family protein [Rossellomorea aquimaris]|nr:Rdx family protein [Rossellomorea aquimaris]